MRVLLLGGTGFIGSHILDRLISDGRHDVKALTRSKELPGIQHCRGNFNNPSDIVAALEGVDVVIHCITTTVPGTSNLDPVADIETNLINSVNLFQLMFKANVKRIIFLSSGGTVYGVPSKLPIPENHPKQPICSYGIVKLAIENYLHLFKDTYGLSPVILRPSNPFGPRQGRLGMQGVISVFMDRILKNEPIDLWGDGSIIRDYIYISDLVDACMLALDSTVEGVFNIGASVGHSLNEIIALLEKTTGRRAIIEYKAGRGFDVKQVVLDTTSAKKNFQWQPKYSLEEGIQLCFDSHIN